MQRLDAHAASSVRLGVLLLQARGDRIQFPFCLREGNGRLKARDNQYARITSFSGTIHFQTASSYRDGNIRRGPKSEILRGHADHGEALIIERDWLAQDT